MKAQDHGSMEGGSLGDRNGMPLCNILSHNRPQEMMYTFITVTKLII